MRNKQRQSECKSTKLYPTYLSFGGHLPTHIENQALEFVAITEFSEFLLFTAICKQTKCLGQNKADFRVPFVDIYLSFQLCSV